MYKLSDKFTCTKDNGIATITGNGETYKLSALGTAVLEKLLAGSSDIAIVNALKAFPGVTRDIDWRLDAMIADLEKAGIIVADKEPAKHTPFQFDAGIDFAGFDLALSK